MANITDAGACVTVAGKEYELTPLTIRDLEWLENYLKQNAIQNGIAAIPEDSSDKQRDAILKAVVSESNKITLANDEGWDALASLSGMSRLAWRMLLTKNPNVTIGLVQEWIKDPGVRGQLLPIISMLNATMYGGGAKKGAQTKSQTVKEKRLAASN